MSARATCRCGWTKLYASLALAEGNAARHVCPTTRRVRRGTYARRCARCGWTGTYDTARKADYAKRRHSCQKREMAMLKAALHEDRMALVDRTPKPCLHKQANHQHGERATYVLDKCRCTPCSEANRLAENERTRLKAYGRYHKYVPGEFVRDHLRELRDYGIGLKRVSEVSGVSNGALTKIWYGLYPDTGRGHERRHGEGQPVRPPARRVLRTTAERIYAVEAIPANLSAPALDHERTPLARTHLRSLVALGWSMSELGRRLGMKWERNSVLLIAGDDRLMQRRTVDAAEALFAELAMTPPPETNQRERIAASRSRRYAAERGWLPPLALDDLDADTAAGPDTFDEVAVVRRIGGDRAVAVGRAERVEIVRRLHARGLSDSEIGQQSGMAAETARRIRQDIGLPASRDAGNNPITRRQEQAS